MNSDTEMTVFAVYAWEEHVALTASGTAVMRLLMDRRTWRQSRIRCWSRDSGLIEACLRALVMVRAGDHWSFKMSRQILPSGSTFGWDILVTNCTLGGVKG